MPKEFRLFFSAWQYFPVLFHYSNIEINVKLDVFFLPLLSAEIMLIDVVKANNSHK
jgi:hypothetical protein